MSGANSAAKPLTRAELLGGFRGGDKRRAAVALSLIEARAARIALERGSVKAPFMTEGAFDERSHAYLAAVVDSATSRSKVSIRDIERSTDAWSSLVPSSPGIRAEIARKVAERYRFSERHVPRLVAALGLETPEVQAAYAADGGGPLATIYADRVSASEQLRWAWSGLSSRIESLPPFWTAFALTLTETVGAGTLALPIAFATVGPLAGVVLLILLGLINLITVSYLAEASARNGSIRYGSAFVGRLVHDFLGASASVLVRVSLFAFCCIVLASYYTGFASTVSAVTGIPEPWWVVVVCGAGLVLILRKTLVGTLASALLIGLVNISILVLLSLFALMNSTRNRLLQIDVPGLSGQGFEASHLQLVFGIVLVSYFGHLSVSNCAQAVLRRDPDGRSLKRGTVAAMLVAIAVYCLWALSVGGAVDADRLRGETGTALVPLAEQLGPQVYVLGVIFAVLGLGMSSVHYGLGIFNMARELIENVGRGKASSLQRVDIGTLVALLPLLLVFGYVQWTYYNGTASFTAPLELLGALLTPVLAGIFPVMLLLASRAQGLPVTGARVSAATSNPVILTVVVCLSFAGLLVHAIVIWEQPVLRFAAFLTTALMLCLIGDLLRRRVFDPCVHVEIRYFPENGDFAEISVAYRGEPINAPPELRYIDGTTKTLAADGLAMNFRRISGIGFRLPRGVGTNLHVYAYRVAADHETSPLAGFMTFERDGNDERMTALATSSGTTRTRMPTPRWRAQLHLDADEVELT